MRPIHPGRLQHPQQQSHLFLPSTGLPFLLSSIPILYFFPEPPRNPPLSDSVHPFCLSLSATPSNPPASFLSARLKPSLLTPSPATPSSPPSENWPPTPSATPSWSLSTPETPVTLVDLMFSGEVGVSLCGWKIERREEVERREKGGKGGPHLWRCRRSCSRRTRRGICPRSRACSIRCTRCTFSLSSPSSLRLERLDL